MYFDCEIFGGFLICNFACLCIFSDPLGLIVPYSRSQIFPNLGISLIVHLIQGIIKAGMKKKMALRLFCKVTHLSLNYFPQY